MRMKLLRGLLLAIVLVCSLSQRARGAPCLDADLIVRNGHIVTMDSSGAIVSALAIRDGRILARGTDARDRWLRQPADEDR